MVTTAAMYDAVLVHRRSERINRSFRHRIHMWLIDLDDVPALPRYMRAFAKFDARDHLGRSDRSIRTNLEEWLARQGVDLAGGRVLMLANPRVLGYTFNPLSVFWCHHRDGTLACVVAEVHNTYGERHCYLLFPDHKGRADAVKDFYVSPFLPGEGRYTLRMPYPDDRLTVAITLYRHERPIFTASLTGARRAATRGAVLRYALRRPLMPQRVAALIRGHGVALWLRGVPHTPHTPHIPQEEVQ